jgi:hypothetical protein
MGDLDEPAVVAGRSTDREKGDPEGTVRSETNVVWAAGKVVDERLDLPGFLTSQPHLRASEPESHS